MVVRIVPNDEGILPGTLARADLPFTDSVLDGVNARHEPRSESDAVAVASTYPAPGHRPVHRQRRASQRCPAASDC